MIKLSMAAPALIAIANKYHLKLNRASNYKKIALLYKIELNFKLN